jgi:hypothetical protein
MYRKVLKKIKESKKAEQLAFDFFKTESDNSVMDRKPHVIFSAENPAVEPKFNMSHEDTINFLLGKGLRPQEVKGVWNGVPERSILVHNPSKGAIKHLKKLARKLGQESILVSDGAYHELHYINGKDQGKHKAGQGTDFLSDKEGEPVAYTEMEHEGVPVKFLHNIADEFSNNPPALLIPSTDTINKSEDQQEMIFPKYRSLEKSHKLNDSPEKLSDIKLIHYSPNKNIKTLNPEYHGSRKIGEEAKRGKPSNPMTFFYLSGSKPEDLVTSGVKSKYVTSLGDKRLYDIGSDPENIYGIAKQKADQKQINQGVVTTDDLHNEIRGAGYHGIYNSKHPTMNNVVGMFEPMNVEEEHDIHPLDFKVASHKNFNVQHNPDESTREAASAHGVNPHFLHKLIGKIKND